MDKDLTPNLPVTLLLLLLLLLLNGIIWTIEMKFVLKTGVGGHEILSPRGQFFLSPDLLKTARSLSHFLSHFNPVHIFTSYIINFDIIFNFYPGIQSALSYSTSQIKILCVPWLRHASYMSHPFHTLCFNKHNNVV